MAKIIIVKVLDPAIALMLIVNQTLEKLDGKLNDPAVGGIMEK